MGTILASTIINRVAVTLFDTNNITWARSELLAWLNAGQRAIAVADPTSNNTTTSIQMVAGARQTIPANGWTLLDVYCNTGLTPGNTPGRSVRLVSRKLLDGFDPNWRSRPAVKDVQNFMFDAQDQTAFWVYPPSNGLGYLQINYAALPADVVEATAITISDAYEQCLIDYILYRAYTKETVGDATKAATSQQAYVQNLAITIASVAAGDPTRSFNPTKPGGEDA